MLKIWYRAILTGAFCLALSSSVLAAGLETDRAVPEAQILERLEKAAFSDEQKAVIREKIDRVKELRAEAQRMHEAVKQQAETNRDLMAQLRERFDVRELQAQIQAKRAELKAFTETELAFLREQTQALRQELRRAVEAGDEERVAALKEQIAALRTEAAPLMEKAAAMKAELQSLVEQTRPLFEELKALREKIGPYHTELEHLFATLKEVRQERKEAIESVRNALEAGNFGKVISGLEAIIQAQREHNQILGQILDLQQKITVILNSYVSA